MKKLFRRSLWSLLTLFVLLNIMSAFHAYKFTHFYDDPTVRKIKPEQMSMTDKLQAMLFGIRYPKSVNDSLPTHPFETIMLTTTEGLKLEGWHCKQDSAKGTVILFHGHGSSKAKILPEANYFYSLGYNTLLMDFRAHGGSDGNTCTIGYKEAEDVSLAYQYVNKSEDNIILWGISLGAATITRAISEYGLQPDKVILEMPFGSLHEAVKGRVRIMGLPQQPIAGMLTFWGGIERGFWAFDHNPCEYAAKIKCDALLQWGRKDSRVTEGEQRCIYESLASEDKKFVVYEESGHLSLCKNEKVKWEQEIRAFLLTPP